MFFISVKQNFEK